MLISQLNDTLNKKLRATNADSMFRKFLPLFSPQWPYVAASETGDRHNNVLSQTMLWLKTLHFWRFSYGYPVASELIDLAHDAITQPAQATAIRRQEMVTLTSSSSSA